MAVQRHIMALMQTQLPLVTLSAPAAFAGLGFSSMYLAAKLHVFDRRGRLWKMTLVLVPLMGAYLIAISRICNYVHHWQDVLVGGALGRQRVLGACA